MMLYFLMVTLHLADVLTQPLLQERCLTGYMTDVQDWVDDSGRLTKRAPLARKIDLSYQFNVNRRLHQQLETFSCSTNNSVEYLSMARNQLQLVPKVFMLTDSCGQSLSKTLVYLTLAGNYFHSTTFERSKFNEQINATAAIVISDDDVLAAEEWTSGFHGVYFKNLRELDLRACGIKELGDSPFTNMPNLERLYLGENNIHAINENSFKGLSNLIHLDLSRNYEYNGNEAYRGLLFGDSKVFAGLTRLQTLDLSYTKLRQKNLLAIKEMSSLQALSICKTELSNMDSSWLAGTSLKFLDVSGNQNIFKDNKALRGVKSTLQVVYADDIALSNLDVFENLSRLEILLVSNNEISTIKKKISKSLTNLQALIMDMNRLTTWFKPAIVLMPKLRLLSLRNNNINLISEEMVNDFENLSYVGISGNFVVCNCNAREMFLVALRNEKISPDEFIYPAHHDNEVESLVYHTGFRDINYLISNRKHVKPVCTDKGCKDDLNSTSSGNFHLFDYDETVYSCLLVVEGRTTSYAAIPSCGARSDIVRAEVMLEKFNTLHVVLPLLILPFFIVGYVFRRNIRYFFITMRNSTMLSLINKDDVMDEDIVYNYDVFVSYCHEDHAWVLDQLLPHVEVDANVSVCLHERDFMVGLSILENIVSCMDRSKTILLILSKKFLQSQWCQFEMHLAQHRLLETRREDLVLVLLEDIPRRLRPNTLHYLMLTNTYIVWPKEEAEQVVFWRRLNKSLTTHKIRQTNNDSLA